MENQPNDNVRYGQEDIEFVFELAETPTDDLLKMVNGLELKGAQIQRQLTLTRQAIERRKAKKATIPGKVAIVTSIVTPSKPKEPDDKLNPGKSRLKDRERNTQEFIEKKGRWVYRSVLEQELDDERLNEIRLTKPDEVREYVRQILRRARDAGFVIDRNVYARSSHNNRVIPTLMYGIPKFEEPELKEHYNELFKQDLKDLGFFETKQEAENSLRDKAFAGQIELNAH